MKAIHLTFLTILKQIKNDFILTMLLIVPFFIGLFFKYGLPSTINLINHYFSFNLNLQPYYELIDVILLSLTPALLNFVIAMIILEEMDEKITTYLSITPLGKKGYLISHLGLMIPVTLVVNLFILALFNLNGFNLVSIFSLALWNALQGMLLAMLIVSLSSNKVEGLAIGKLTTILTLALLIPYFIGSNLQYLFSIIPSFWLAHFLISSNYLYLLVSLMVMIIWFVLIYIKFKEKIR